MTYECELIQGFSNSDIWAFFEGDMDKDRENMIRTHCLWCRPCLESFACATQRIREEDIKRYERFSQEQLAVRRAELLRFCKKRGLEVDVSKIKEHGDYFKQTIGALLNERREEFFKIWDNLTETQRDKLVLSVIQYLYGSEDEETE